MTSSYQTKIALTSADLSNLSLSALDKKELMESVDDSDDRIGILHQRTKITRRLLLKMTSRHNSGLVLDSSAGRPKALEDADMVTLSDFVRCGGETGNRLLAPSPKDMTTKINEVYQARRSSRGLPPTGRQLSKPTVRKLITLLDLHKVVAEKLPNAREVAGQDSRNAFTFACSAYAYRDIPSCYLVNTDAMQCNNLSDKDVSAYIDTRGICSHPSVTLYSVNS